MRIREGSACAALVAAACVLLASACDENDTIGDVTGSLSPGPDAGAPPAASNVAPAIAPAAAGAPAAASSDGLASAAPIECPLDRDVLARVAPATYAIIFRALGASGEIDPVFAATAFAVGPNLLATNAHVTRALEALVARAAYQDVVAVQAGTGTVVALERAVSHPDYANDPLSQPDVGLLTTRELLPAVLSLAPADGTTSVAVTDDIYVVGFAGDDSELVPIVPGETVPQATALAGDVTALRRFDPSLPVTPATTDIIQHDAPTSPGMSGAPLSSCGLVVAVNDVATLEQGLTPDPNGDLLVDRVGVASNDFGIDVEHLHALMSAFSSGTLEAFDLNAHPTPAGEGAPSQLCTDTCIYAGDAECDDGGPGALPDVYCALGTDCTDCGPRDAPLGVPPVVSPSEGPASSPPDASAPPPLASDWVVFTDAVTGQRCDTVNGADFEAIVLSPSRELMIVSSFDETGLASSVDSVATGLIVDESGNFLVDGMPSGAVVAFAADANGESRLWALVADGTVLASATELSGFTPVEFRNVRCEACGVIDAAPPALCP
jgi:trypsin-like peptidase